jgi:hypothetical protein
MGQAGALKSLRAIAPINRSTKDQTKIRPGKPDMVTPAGGASRLRLLSGCRAWYETSHPQPDFRSRYGDSGPGAAMGPDDPETVKLTGICHNLIRYWAEV